jgi:tRNA (cmo5U34)-methyltransferase
MSSSAIIEFFNQISSEYDDFISRTVPRYREMFWAIMYYLPPDFVPSRILELGCGTGNLTRLAHERWPNSHITVVDISEEMLQKTAEKLGPRTQLTSVQSYFEDLDFAPGQFDLVMSSIAMHHILDPEKERLIGKIHQWLRPGGFFVLGDQIQGANPRLYQADVAFYEAYAQENGASPEDVRQWREHRETLDHYATLDDLTRWMKQSGFQDVDVLWRYCFWAVIQAQKPTLQ